MCLGRSRGRGPHHWRLLWQHARSLTGHGRGLGEVKREGRQLKHMLTRDRSRERGRERRQAQQAQPKPNVVPPGLSGGFYKPLAEADVQRIHDAALTVLEETGIEVMPSP